MLPKFVFKSIRVVADLYVATCQVGWLMTILGETFQDTEGTYMKTNEAIREVCTLKFLI